jgi:predicted hydrocarbon binding protein
MEKKRIDKADFEAILSGEKDITGFFDINPADGKMVVFGVHTASNPDYLIRAIYEMFEGNLNRRLAVQAVKKLYRSVGLGAVGLNKFLKKLKLDLDPVDFMLLVFRLQHQQGWGAPMEVVERNESRLVLRCQATFESDVMKDWNMQVCGLHSGWIEGILSSVTGSNWVCEEKKCAAAGDSYCEFVAEKKTPTWTEITDSILKGDTAITEFIEHKPLEGTITFIDRPVIIMPRIIFTSLMGSMSRIVGEAAAGGVVNYRAYMELGSQNIAYFRSMGITDPAKLVDLALTMYSQMGWFKVVGMDWDEARKEKVIRLEHTAESQAVGKAAKPVCYCTSGLLAGIVSAAYGVKVQGKEVKCQSKGDQYCEFTVKDKVEEKS